MKKKLVVVLMAAVMAMTAVTGCGSKADDAKNDTQASKTSESETSANADQEAAMHVADLIDAIYVQERTDDTDKQCKEAKEAWDKLTDAQKELVEGENADPDYFGRDTGDASKDDPRPLCYIFSFFVRRLRNRLDYYITTCNIIQQIFIRRFTDTFTKAVQKAAKYSAAACLQMRYHLCFPHTPPLKPQTSLSHPLLFFRCTESCTCIQNPQNSSTCS